ncbi:unnamed protein product [Caenorhabditis auriculariae]|uniref:Uncharacterized protein n=1 Tax=Caenorhabditis auriculariae TaxID=2777116 RepID=A0A8S1H1V5_9PELO|nr:unnamed protein product [Caenorhabditis auriculariae]
MKPTTVFHVFMFFAFVFVCWKDYLIVYGDLLPMPGQFLSKFVWLTMINLYLHTFYHFFGIFISLAGSKSTTFDYAARAFVGPIGVTVTVLFWALYLADPANIADDIRGRQILAIQWFNHGLHTLPLASSVLDHIVWNHKGFHTRQILQGIATFCAFYLADIHIVHHYTGFWAYPIIGDLSPPLRIVFFAVCIGVFYLSYLFQSLVHTTFHRRQVRNASKKK